MGLVHACAAGEDSLRLVAGVVDLAVVKYEAYSDKGPQCKPTNDKNIIKYCKRELNFELDTLLYWWCNGYRRRNCDQAVVGSIPGRAAIKIPSSTQPSIPPV